MAKWKLSRQTFGTEEFCFLEGQEVTVGRGTENVITLKSIVVSRYHCIINVQREQVLITDLKSSNGIYVGTKKIPQNTPFVLEENDVIGFGWTVGAAVQNINDKEKYVFKLVKEKPLCNRITFQSDDELEGVEKKVASLTNHTEKNESPVLCPKVQLKRKLKMSPKNLETETDPDIINISDSDMEQGKEDTTAKKIKLEPITKEPLKQTIKDDHIKSERGDLEYEAFNIKQEYLGYDDGPIQIDSDDDLECENWISRLSQSSPGKPFIKLGKSRESKVNLTQEESSYSQLDDLISYEDDHEDILDDFIIIPPYPPKDQNDEQTDNLQNNLISENSNGDDEVHYEDFFDDLKSFEKPSSTSVSSIHASKTIEENNKDDVNRISYLPNQSATSSAVLDSPKEKSSVSPIQSSKAIVATNKDDVDGILINYLPTELATSSAVLDTQNEKNKKTQMIEPLVHVPKRKTSSYIISESKLKSFTSRQSKDKKHSSSRRHITNSQKEERKKKLKEIATKEKEECEQKANKNSNNFNSKQEKPLVIAKVTTSNRGAFLTDVGVVKPVSRLASPKKSSRSVEKSGETSPKDAAINKISEPREEKANKSTFDHKSSRHKDKHKVDFKTKSSHKPIVSETKVPLKSLKPLSESEDSISGKPFSKVEPFAPKSTNKKVRFSEAEPIMHIFEIQEGNKMRKTSLIKTSKVDLRQKPFFSLEKITLIKILRWNPHWFEEQLTTNGPPPILGHDNPPLTIFHSFVNHAQYVQLVGDLLLMEIWECLTQGYMKPRNNTAVVHMRIDSVPPVPARERHFDLFNFSVDLSVLNSDQKLVPRIGEIMLLEFGPETIKNRRFFFVHNVRRLPSPPNNIHSFFSISLQACYSEKMKSLKPGEQLIGRSLTYINNELLLFEAMEYLAGSPLREAILKPEPQHFVSYNRHPVNHINSQWTKTLNSSQQTAVNASVAAALGDKPSIQMVQGPPGTGKSSVICTMVMSYFYDSHGKKQHNRGKILICATSNAAVDELVIRLLNIRQRLPKNERFRMVRVGRAEAMHRLAADVSSQNLAQRGAARAAEPSHPGLNEEISHLDAKVNMWKTLAQDAKDPVRIAYCQGRVHQLVSRIALLRGGGGGESVRADQPVDAERRIVERADIILTTLASAFNHKMRGVKHRVALCIVDEAGQATEPEILIPLMLDVKSLTLIGDPQQLPGFICSQRAKKHGLGESLFSRLSSFTWQDYSPVVLLNQQYRMHPDIADYPNRAFYDGRILTTTARRPDLNIPPYCIVSISSGDKGQVTSGANEIEAWGVSRLVVALNSVVRDLGLNLAVITPYNAHKDLIKKNLKFLQDPDVEVNTVDSFQGQERDVVVVSLARSHGVGFLNDAGRMNVMLTRAKHALLVCLNPHAMLKHAQWRTLVEDAQRRNLYRHLPSKMCQMPVPGHTDDILKYITYHKKTKSYK